MPNQTTSSQTLAAAITRSASKQTYYTIRFFVDRGRVADAYRAYGYFRWVDDVLDLGTGSRQDKIAFINRQKSILETCYRGEVPRDACPEELMLIDLIRNQAETNSGLQTYIRNMMDVMTFDACRRGMVISQAELCEYTQKLAAAVTEALHHFIGHANPTPPNPDRYLAVSAAHITHMLRDAFEDTEAGYINIPGEILQLHGISPRDVEKQAYQEWVRGRIHLARRYFKAGRASLAQVKSYRCRLAGYAYTARFEWMLRTIERDNYCLRRAYPQRRSLGAGLWMGWQTLASMVNSLWVKGGPHQLAAQSVRMDKP